MTEEGLSLGQKASLAINKSIEGQRPTIKNLASRKMSEWLFGKEIPYVTPEVKQAVEVLAVPDEQRRYLEAYHTLDTVDSVTRSELFPAFSRSAERLRKSIGGDFKDAGDRMEGLIFASQRTLSLIDYSRFNNGDKFTEELERVARRLVENETKFATDFRKAVQGNETPEAYYDKPNNTLAWNEIATILKLSALELRYLEDRLTVNKYNHDSPEAKRSEDSALALMKSINPENPHSPEVSDRINGLNLAYDRISQLGGNQMLSRMPNFREEISKVADGLVDKETKFFSDFRKYLELS